MEESEVPAERQKYSVFLLLHWHPECKNSASKEAIFNGEL
jgi:hypothetical protein